MLQKSVLERHQKLSDWEKDKNQEYSRERYKSFPEDEKQGLVEYIKKYFKI